MAYEFKYTVIGIDYYYNSPILKLSPSGKGYNGVANVIGSNGITFSIPIYVKYDEIDLITNKINEEIENYLKK